MKSRVFPRHGYWVVLALAALPLAVTVLVGPRGHAYAAEPAAKGSTEEMSGKSVADGASANTKSADAAGAYAERVASGDAVVAASLDPKEREADRPFPSVQELVAEVRRRAPEVVRALAQQRVGEARRVGAKLSPLTNPYLEVFLNRGTRGATQDISVDGNLWLPIEMSGQRRKRIAETEAFVDWMSSNVLAAQAGAIGAAVQAYGDCTTAAGRVAAVERLMEFSKQQAVYFRDRFDRGDATRQEAKLAEAELARVRVLKEESAADLDRARGSLAALLRRPVGMPVAAEAAISASVDSFPAASLAAALRLARRAPLVRALQQESDYYRRAAERTRRSAQDPVNLIVSAGRGDLGETRYGGGLAWSLPSTRRGQGQRAVLRAEGARARTQGTALVEAFAQRLVGLAQEREHVRKAIEVLELDGIPAAHQAVDAAYATQRAGKTGFVVVLTAQRDRTTLELRRLRLMQREWSILADMATLTGQLPGQGGV